MSKPERIRDPVHDLIEFGTAADPDQRQLEQVLWRVIETRPFQRLRRIKQLGFSELVFPGATHTRFAHSIGVFHTARLLVGAIRRSVTAIGRDFDAHQARVAMAAALLHDVGHGMFSHAFERLGKHFGLALVDHEAMSDRLIRSDEIRAALGGPGGLGPSFADEVADMVKAKQPSNLYASVVSSQFDADRLDYMQRDRLMTGVQSSDVDATWLIANLEVGSVKTGSEDGQTGAVETLVLSHKARQTAESYVLAILHLYQNVYGHKATRGVEAAFFALMSRILELQGEGNGTAVGLPEKHPILRFVANPENADRTLNLDDTVFWGALSQLVEAADQPVASLARRMRDRKLPSCIDIRRQVEEALPPLPREEAVDRKARLGRVKLICGNVVSALEEQQAGVPLARRPVLVDEYERSPYRRFDTGRTPMNQIHMRQGNSVRDVAELSAIVAGAESFEICRAYDFSDDGIGTEMVKNIIGTELKEANCGDP
ncbi:MAG TPA: HD domain-containing protein [Acetobacteraceae bacterium]|nr:HD domain-containing protein [Acetobacteraceae bacterium]